MVKPITKVVAPNDDLDDGVASQLAREWFVKRGLVIEPRSWACPECGQRSFTEADVRSLASLLQRVRGEIKVEQPGPVPDVREPPTSRERACLQEIGRLKRGAGFDVRQEPCAVDLIRKGLLEFYSPKDAAEERRFAVMNPHWFPRMRLTKEGRFALSRAAALKSFVES